MDTYIIFVYPTPAAAAAALVACHGSHVIICKYYVVSLW